MKQITQEDLRRLALAKGATITHDGNVINPNRQRLELARPPTQAPAEVATLPPAPAEPPPPQPDSGELVAIAVRENGQTMAALTAALIREVRAQQSGMTWPAPITHWEFIVQRDPNTMYLTGITAIATRDQP